MMKETIFGRAIGGEDGVRSESHADFNTVIGSNQAVIPLTRKANMNVINAIDKRDIHTMKTRDRQRGEWVIYDRARVANGAECEGNE